MTSSTAASCAARRSPAARARGRPCAPAARSSTTARDRSATRAAGSFPPPSSAASEASRRHFLVALEHRPSVGRTAPCDLERRPTVCVMERGTVYDSPRRPPASNRCRGDATGNVEGSGSLPQAVIAGIGETRIGNVPELSDIGMCVHAAAAAVEDAGIRMQDIDGLLVQPPFHAVAALPHPDRRVARHLRQDPLRLDDDGRRVLRRRAAPREVGDRGRACARTCSSSPARSCAPGTSAARR